jgi:FtsX-like permease family protein/MacB-like protein
MPQVEAATIAGNATPPSDGADLRVDFLGRPELGSQEIRIQFIGPEYFSLLHIPLMQGRIWDHTETMRAAPLVVINETMARRYWPNGDAIGHSIKTPDLIDQSSAGVPSAPGATGWLQIIGVAADSLNDGLRDPIRPGVYLPYSIHMWGFTRILAKTRVAPLSLIQDVRTQIAKVDSGQQLVAPRDLITEIQIQPEYANQRLVATLFGIFSALALALAVVGLYSVVSYSVATRTNEFGIRLTLGASARDIARLVISSTTATVASGLAAGIALSLALSKFFTFLLNEPSRDPLLLVVVASILSIAALAAALLPALRASHTDPMTALRHD